MCRYAFSGPYRQHYACFYCRKMFRPTMEVNAEKAGAVFPCPQCKQPMHNMGLDFKAPKQHDIQQWRKVETLYQHGYRYGGCGCGPGYRPKTLKEVPAFLQSERVKQEARVRQVAQEERERDRVEKRRLREAKKPKKVTWSFYDPAGKEAAG